MKLLLSGYYGFGNLGDEAILSGLVQGLKARGHSVTVLSNDPLTTASLHGVTAAHRVRGAPGALLKTDAFISGGGGLLQDKTSLRSLHYYLTLLRLAKRLGKRAFVYGQSVGPLSERGRAAVAGALRGVHVAVRDERSRALLASLDVSAHLVADAALLLEPPPKTTAERVILVPRAGYPAITEALSHLGNSLRAQAVPVAAAAVQPDEDGAALAQLTRAIPDLDLLPATSPGELLRHLSAARYVVSGRLHGLILAAVAGTNACGLVYDPKVAAFAEEAGAPAFDLPVEGAALLRCVQENRPLSSKKLEVLKARAVQGLDWVDATLSGKNA